MISKSYHRRCCPFAKKKNLFRPSLYPNECTGEIQKIVCSSATYSV
jgi:hypothetical protein